MKEKMVKTIEKINVTKNIFMKQLIKLINFQPGKTGEKGHKLPISGMREVASIQILQNIERLLRKQSEQLYGNKFNNLDEVNKLPKLTQQIKSSLS